MEETQKLLFEILSRISALEVRTENVSKSFDNLNVRLEEIERNHQKTMGAIQFATATVTLVVAMMVTFANLWVDQKINEHIKHNEPETRQEIQK